MMKYDKSQYLNTGKTPLFVGKNHEALKSQHGLGGE